MKLHTNHDLPLLELLCGPLKLVVPVSEGSRRVVWEELVEVSVWGRDHYQMRPHTLEHTLHQGWQVTHVHVLDAAQGGRNTYIQSTLPKLYHPHS